MTNDTDARESLPAATGGDFGLRNPLEISAQLRNLVRQGGTIVAHTQGENFTAQLLDACLRTRTIVFTADTTRNHEKLLTTPHLLFQASPRGVRVEFSTGMPRETLFDGVRCLEVDFPAVLLCVQRREHFRVNTPVDVPFTCCGKLADGSPFVLELKDLSLGGIGVRSGDARLAQTPGEFMFRDCALELGTSGTVAVDLQLVSVRPVADEQEVPSWLYGFQFATLSLRTENLLSQLISRLELGVSLPDISRRYVVRVS